MSIWLILQIKILGEVNKIVFTLQSNQNNFRKREIWKYENSKIYRFYI